MTLAFESNLIVWIVMMGEENMGGGKGRMTAQVYFFHGGEPSDMKLVVFVNRKRSLREVVLHGDVLHELVIEPVI
jgi:hypothetical protein